MTRFLKVAFASSLLFLFIINDCPFLLEGKYRIIQIRKSLNPNSDIRTETKIFIDNNNFSQYWDSGDSAKGKIIWIYNCTFRLDYSNRKSEDTSELGKLILKSFGDPCFELKEKNGDTILFRTTYSENLHVTTSEGMIVKVK